MIDGFDSDSEEDSDTVTSIHEMKDRISNNLVMYSIVEFSIQQLVFFLLAVFEFQPIRRCITKLMAKKF